MSFYSLIALESASSNSEVLFASKISPGIENGEID